MRNPLPERMDAIIVSLEKDNAEMKELARSMNYKVRTVFVQNRGSPHPKFFIGKGKVEEIADHLRSEEGKNIKMAVVNSPLKPTQVFHLQSAWDLTVFDRTRLILEIFSNRARSQEARLQVELARLEYEVPLVKELIHRSKMGEHPGYMAGGEYQVDQYYEMIRKRIKKIRARLKAVKKDRDVKRRHRREEGFFLASIAGYTNAGKSMLLKALTDEEVIIEDSLFSTLYTTTRKGVGRKGRAFLFSDTVGFIKDLPPWLIDAFHSTLEETFLADIVLLVIDGFEEEGTIFDKVVTSYRFLQDRDRIPPIHLVFNKSDLVDDQERYASKISSIIDRMTLMNMPYIGHDTISALTGQNVSTLMDNMIGSLKKLDYVDALAVELSREANRGKENEVNRFINSIMNDHFVLSNQLKGDLVSLVILCKRPEKAKIENQIQKSGLVFRA